jgi:FkbM family methyltransferase
MRSKIREGLKILMEEGPSSFIQEVLHYILETVRYTIVGSYTLSIGDTSVSFTAPNPRVVKRNKRRFETEQRELTDLLREIEDNDVFFDIGANTGLYSLFAAKRAKSVEVVAFEPYPPNVRLLKHDIERNNLGNISVREVALSDSEGKVEFNQPEIEDIGYGSGAIDSSGDNSSARVEVPATKGDELISKGEIPAPNIVKIDVEGAEPLVLDGMEDALGRSECRLVFCEIHLNDVEHRPSISDFGVSLSDMKLRFEKLGYEVEELQTKGAEVLLKAYK